MDFKKQFGEVTKSYLILKDAFVKSDAQAVKLAAENTIATMKNVDMEVLTGEAHSKWMKLQKTIMEK